MFFVLAHTDEYLAAHAVIDAINADNDPAAYQAAYDALASVPEFRCCGIYETEAAARASFHYDDDGEYDPVTWRGVACLFICGEATDGRFVVHMGDNGWELARSSPSIAVGLFATREEACKWADMNGSVDQRVFELDMAHVEQAAA